MNNIVLIGMPGSGKSTVGVLLAKALGYDFLDVDLIIQQREGLLLQEIIDTRGTRNFLLAEEGAVCSIQCTRTVVAPGGSAVCSPRAAQHLRQLGIMVYLHVDPEDLETRIQNLDSRGIVMEPGQTLVDVLAVREPLYEKYADLSVNCTGLTLPQTVQQVLQQVRGSLGIS